MTEIEGLFEQQEREREALERERAAERRIDSTLELWLQTTNGREAMAWLLSLTGHENSISSTEPLVMALLSGKRDVGLAIAERLEEACPALYDILRKEVRDGRNGGSHNK